MEANNVYKYSNDKFKLTLVEFLQWKLLRLNRFFEVVNKTTFGNYPNRYG
jgi:hypothetical protein